MIVGGSSLSGSIPPVRVGRGSRLLPAPGDRRGLLIATVSTVVLFAAIGYVVVTSPGWDRFRETAAFSSVPVYAIGGLTRADMQDAWRAGAHGVAMIRGAWG